MTLRSWSAFRGRPDGRLRGTTRPWSISSPPHTPQCSRRSTAPARHASRIGHLPHIAFALSTSPGDAENHRSGSCTRHGSGSPFDVSSDRGSRAVSASLASLRRSRRRSRAPLENWAMTSSLGGAAGNCTSWYNLPRVVSRSRTGLEPTTAHLDAGRASSRSASHRPGAACLRVSAAASMPWSGCAARAVGSPRA